MPSVQRTMIDALRTALEGAGFKVFNGIKGHHTGFRTRTRSYIEIAQTINRESNNITAGCISGPFTLRLKYYQHKQWVTNSEGQAQGLEDCLQLMEQAFSQVWVPGMYTPFDCRVVESVAGNNNSYYTEYELYGTLGTLQDRGEIQGLPVNTVAPVVSGTPREGETLTVAPGTWIGEPPITYAYQWLNNGSDIVGETGLTYLVPAGILGDTISCNEIATNPFTPELDPPYVTAESNGLVVTENIAPTFDTNPVISGTPEPGETLTAVNGTASGDPTPVITGEWYLDAVATGETGLTYVVPDSVGSDVTYLNTATNVAGVDTALSNSLEIVSGYIYPLEAISKTPIVAYSAWALLTARPAINTSIRVISTPSDIGYEDEKFSGTEWDVATTSGANVAYASKWVDQYTAIIDAIQNVESRQFPTSRDGVFTTVNDDKWFDAAIPNTTYPKFSFIANVKIADFSGFGVISSKYNTSGAVGRSFSFNYNADRLQVTSRVLGVNKTASSDLGMAALLGTTSFNRLYFTYDETAGVRIFYNGGNEITMASNFTGVADASTALFTIANYNNGASQSNIEIDTAIPFADTLTQQDCIDFDAAFVSNLP